jgi:hypothetical protein
VFVAFVTCRKKAFNADVGAAWVPFGPRNPGRQPEIGGQLPHFDLQAIQPIIAGIQINEYLVNRIVGLT